MKSVRLTHPFQMAKRERSPSPEVDDDLMTTWLCEPERLCDDATGSETLGSTRAFARVFGSSSSPSWDEEVETQKQLTPFVIFR